MQILLQEHSAEDASSCAAAVRHFAKSAYSWIGSLFLAVGRLLVFSSVCTVGKDPRWCRFVLRQEEDPFASEHDILCQLHFKKQCTVIIAQGNLGQVHRGFTGFRSRIVSRLPSLSQKARSRGFAIVAAPGLHM